MIWYHTTDEADATLLEGFRDGPGRQSSSQVRFRKAVRQTREDRGWSQAGVPKMLKGKGIDNMHSTTVAKIEAGDREVKLDEAAAMADLFGTSVNAMLGKGMPDESSLTFALTNVSSYAAMGGRHTVAARQTATDLKEILEDIEDRFERTAVPDLMDLAREAARHLDSAKSIYDRLDLAATEAIANEGRGGTR